jgi:ribosomal protein L37E
LVTLQRRANTRGDFSPDRFRARTADDTTHELALNPDTFDGRTDEEVLSTLVDEMVHVWQECFGKPPRKAYHDKQWAAKMEEVGLMPSTTGEPGGKRTGQRVTHYIVAGGPYASAYARLKQLGYQLGWQSAPNGTQSTAKRASKTKFSCAVCGQNAWAKPDAAIACGPCGVMMDAAA